MYSRLASNFPAMAFTSSGFPERSDCRCQPPYLPLLLVASIAVIYRDTPKYTQSILKVEITV
ncbi:hypothetical protein ACRRTK_023836 [Alexandromys fortis]